MPNETANQPLLLTLTGRVTVHFMDGQSLAGEFISQDMFNIFLTVDSEPLMIPRSQIKFIQGRPGQTVEPDKSQLTIAPLPVEEVTIKSVQGKATASIFDTDVSLVETAAKEPFATPHQAQELTVGLAEEEDEDMTVFLETEGDLDLTVFLDEDEEDETLRLDEEEDDDSTLSLKETPPVTAYLECIAGPHAGERFQLRSEVTTLGRSSDNTFAISNDKEISRRHALITPQVDGSFGIEDRGSLNGIIIDDIRIEGRHTLKEGENVLIGISLFVFHEK